MNKRVDLKLQGIADHSTINNLDVLVQEEAKISLNASKCMIVIK